MLLFISKTIPKTRDSDSQLPGVYVQVVGMTIKAMKERINIAQSEALGNDLQES